MMDFEVCPICNKKIEAHFMENHHYKPKSQGGTSSDTIRTCGTCHDILHLYIPLDEIENYPTPESIRNHPLIALYSGWICLYNHTGHWNVKKTLQVMAS
jgi:hypothetical protein